MEHLEIHVIASTHDTELAVIAGLIPEGDPSFPNVECQMCEVTIQLDHSRHPSSPFAYVLLNEDEEKVSCEPCLGVALASLMP